MVLEITEDKNVHAINTVDGYMILRPRPSSWLYIAGADPVPSLSLGELRPAGIFTAGTAQAVCQQWRAIWWANG